MTSFPPQRAYLPTSLSTAEVQQWLTTYLLNCENTALLQPDALLTPSGPIQVQGMSSVTIHNLKRLQSGLDGKYDLNPPAVDSREADKEFKSAVVNVEEIYTLEEGWQNKGEFEREQSIEMGEIEGMTVKSQKQPKVMKDNTSTVVDKQARKKAKKENKKKWRSDKQKNDEE